MEILYQVINYLPFSQLLGIREVSKYFKDYLETSFKFKNIFRITSFEYILYKKHGTKLDHNGQYICLNENFILRWIEVYGEDDFQQNFINKYNYTFYKITDSNVMIILVKYGYNECEWRNIDQFDNISENHMDIYMEKFGYKINMLNNKKYRYDYISIIRICLKYKFPKIQEYLLNNCMHKLVKHYVDLENERFYNNITVNIEKFIKMFPNFIENNADDILLRIAKIYKDCGDLFFTEEDLYKILGLCNDLLNEKLLDLIFSNGMSTIIEYIQDNVPNARTLLIDAFKKYLAKNDTCHNSIILQMLPHLTNK